MSTLDLANAEIERLRALNARLVGLIHAENAYHFADCKDCGQRTPFKSLSGRVTCTTCAALDGRTVHDSRERFLRALIEALPAADRPTMRQPSSAPVTP